MSDDQPTVSVTALKFHTLDGQAHQTGETYAVDAAQVDNLVAQGMATPVDAPAPPAAPPPASHPVTPLGTADFLPKLPE